MAYLGYDDKSLVTSEKIRNIINENKQLIYGINSLKHSDKFKAKVSMMLSRLQKNLFFLAHLCNQPKSLKSPLGSQISGPIVSLDYSTESTKFQHPNSTTTSNLVLNTAVVPSNASQPIYFGPNCLELRSNDLRSPDQMGLQTCDGSNINNIRNNSISKVNLDNITPITLDYDTSQNVGFHVGASSPNQNFMQSQSTEHFICRYCQRKCRNQSGLTQHTMKVHPDAPEVQHLLKQAQSRSNPNPLSIINVGSPTF